MKLPKTRAAAMAALSPRYMTGKPCKNGHIAERVTTTGACVECVKDIKNAEKARRREFAAALREAQNGAD